MTPRRISISTLSPVHIGCDEVYEPSNFVITDGLLHSLDPADLAADLTEAERKQLATLAEGREPIGALQCFFRDHAARFAGLARHQVPVAQAIVNQYEKSAGKPTQRGTGGEATYNMFPIARTAYRPFDNVPYLPGSSLKGSIRTAWLNHLNRGAALRTEDKKNSGRLQERLLGYATGKFENDPFRHIGLADAHPEEDDLSPPAHVLYAISKKKRQAREGESRSPEHPVFLETVSDAFPAAFFSELRLSGKIDWNALCEACNAFYKPQMEAELNHPVLGSVIEIEWKSLIVGLLANELGELIAARQGFLLRVGRHSGAESVTLDGVREIKILGPRVDGRQTSDYRPNTTQKRYASLTKAGVDGLLPFGWIWVDACDDAHAHIFDTIRKKLAARSAPLREAQQDRRFRLEEKQQQRKAVAAELERKHHAAETAARAEADAEAARRALLATMSPNLQRVEGFKAAFAERAQQLRGGRERLNADFHTRARDLARDALSGADWTNEEKHAVAEAITEWLPKVVEKIDKDQFKKLKLSTLRTA